MAASTGRILLAEDEDRVAGPLVHALERAGHEVRRARAVREVRGELPAFAPDVLLLDITLDTDGLELLQALRFAPEHPPGGVVVLAERGAVSRAERAHQLGAAAVVTKPVSGERLLTVIDDLLGSM